MDVLQQVGQGFLIALAPQNLLFCFIGVLMGTLIGVLPGIGPVSGVAILLPIVFTLEPTAAMIMLGLTMLTRLAGKSLIKGLMMGMFGLALGTIGLDPMTGVARYTAGRVEFLDGVGFVSVAMGLFALGEIFTNAEESLNREVFKTSLKGLLPSAQDWFAVRWTLVRATIIGFFVGALPGAGATVASFMAYVAEKKASKHPEKFGTGVIEGVAAPEAANNAATGGALVPLLTLGIPSSATAAILLGAINIFGLRPGPLLAIERPDFFWAVVASMYIGNVMLVILNLPLVGFWASILRIPYGILLPFIVLFTLIGTYAINNNPFDLFIMLG